MKNAKFLNVLLIIGIIIVLVGIGFLSYGYYKKVTEKLQNPIVTMEIEGYGKMTFELYPDKAPNTVTNFIKLANDGYYNGLTFHRTIPDFMIQGGDKEGDGSGKLDYSIEGEFSANGYKNNTINFERGILAMARADYTSQDSSLTTQSYNSAGAQFFITTTENKNLNGLYAPFGKILEGESVLDAIANVEVVTRDSSAETGVDKPVNPPVITSVTVETFGATYGEPKKLETFDYNSYVMNKYYSQNGQ